MVWVLASVALDGGQAGDNTGLWSAIITMFVAIVLVGGLLAVYLVRAVKRANAEIEDNGQPLS